RIQPVVVAVGVVLLAESHRRPKLGVAERKPELARHHADHRIRLAVECHAPPENAGLAAELRLPQPIAQKSNARRALAVLAFTEETADERLHAERGKEIGGHRGAGNAHW